MLSNVTSHGCSSAALTLLGGIRLAVPGRSPDPEGWEDEAPACGRECWVGGCLGWRMCSTQHNGSLACRQCAENCAGVVLCRQAGRPTCACVKKLRNASLLRSAAGAAGPVAWGLRGAGGE